MTVQELINSLQTIEDKSKLIGYRTGGNEFKTLDDLIGILEWKDAVILQHEVKVN